MRLLLDTCILYDWMMGAMADAEAVQLIQQTGAWVSAVSVWEMAIKHGLGKLPLPSRQIVADVGAQGFGWLSITPGHAQAVLAQVTGAPFEQRHAHGHAQRGRQLRQIA